MCFSIWHTAKCTSHVLGPLQAQYLYTSFVQLYRIHCYVHVAYRTVTEHVQLILLDLNSAKWQCSCILKIAPRPELPIIYQNPLHFEMMQNSV